MTSTAIPEKDEFSSLLKSPDIKNSINQEALQLAMAGYRNLKRQGLLKREGILTLIDFEKPSVNERLYVIDVESGKLLYSVLVAHGKGSGRNQATKFSNISGSNKSSVGFYLTDTTYQGKNGYSLVLKGMEPGINDRAESRGIVMHGANYVSYRYIQRHGRLGRSQGCPALSWEDSRQIIDLIKGGSCLFIFHNAREYASRSVVLRQGLVFHKKSASQKPV